VRRALIASAAPAEIGISRIPVTWSSVTPARWGLRHRVKQLGSIYRSGRSKDCQSDSREGR
jgi:hypothetical protein